MKETTRRSMLHSAMVVPGAVLGLNGAVPPSDKVTLGAIGLGGRGLHVLGHFLDQPDVHVPAVADCFADRRRRGKELVDSKYGNGDCQAYRLHEKILERKDIDAVLIATGDRWHTVASVLAARAGKDVYCEKPFCLTIGEGRTLVREIERTGSIWQCGTQRRSNPGYQFVVDVVRSGRIGKLHTITTSNGCGPGWRRKGKPQPAPEPSVDVFDYNRWLGQAPWARYSPLRVQLWRLNWATGGGSIADMGAHYMDFAQWVHDSEGSGPVEFEGEGQFLPPGEFNNTPYFYHVRARYTDGVRLYIDPGPKGVRFDGDGGWIRLSDEGELTTDRPEVLKGLTVPDSHWKILVPHIRNFLECMRTRKRPASHPEVAHRAHTIVHCANLCLRLGRTLGWDPEEERFVADKEANGYLNRPMREPWDAVAS